MVFMRARIAGLKNPAMRDDALVRFTAHEIPREDLHALMARSDGPALRRGVWHLGMLVLIGAALWRLRSTAWALPLVVVQGYMLAFIFCALHETAHRRPSRPAGSIRCWGRWPGSWVSGPIGTIACTTGSITASRRTWSGIPSSTSRSPPPCPCTS